MVARGYGILEPVEWISATPAKTAGIPLCSTDPTYSLGVNEFIRERETHRERRTKQKKEKRGSHSSSAIDICVAMDK
jgi:hypothetical protein